MKKYEVTDKLEFAGASCVVKYSKTSFGIHKFIIESDQEGEDNILLTTEEMLVFRNLLDTLLLEV